jgi:hypothetical protein
VTPTVVGVQSLDFEHAGTASGTLAGLSDVIAAASVLRGRLRKLRLLRYRGGDFHRMLLCGRFSFQ